MPCLVYRKTFPAKSLNRLCSPAFPGWQIPSCQRDHIGINYRLLETYRSGHNGADSKSVSRGNPARGFESRRLRYFYVQIIILLPSDICLPHLSIPAMAQIHSPQAFSYPDGCYTVLQPC